MGLNRRWRELLLVVLAWTGCGWLPPDTPPAKPAPPDPDAEILHDWTIAGHVLGPRALISEADAAAFHGRTVAIVPTGYASPWSGRCDEAHRDKHARTLADLTAELGLANDRTPDHTTDRAQALGLADPVVEYRLLCGIGGVSRTPPLILYVGHGVPGAHALTCWSGVCYVLTR